MGYRVLTLYQSQVVDAEPTTKLGKLEVDSVYDIAINKLESILFDRRKMIDFYLGEAKRIGGRLFK